MPPRARPVKPVNRMVPDANAATAATLKTPTAGPSARPVLATAVPSKSSRTLFAEDDSESLTLSAKLAALRIEQAAGGKEDKGKGKDADVKDAVSDADDDASGDEDHDAPDATRRYNFMDDEDDGLQAHDPKECFEDKAKEDLAAKLRFPLTLLIPSDHLQEVRRTQATVKELLGMWGNELTKHAAKTTFQELDPSYIAKRVYGRMQVIFVAASDANFVWRNRVEHHGKLMLAGDLNVVEDPILDRSPVGGSSGENARMLQLFSGLHMVDAFRMLNPSGREYTFYAGATKSSSRIDRILVSAELLPSVAEAVHTRSLRGISDHKCGIKVVLQASLRLHFGGLLTKLKATLRRYAAEERKRVRATLRHLELAVSGLQQELMRNPQRDDLRVTLAEKESQLAAYLKGENDRLHLLVGVKEETKGEIASRVLSAKVKSKKARTMITVLASHGVEQRGTRGILEAASRFYAQLFAEAPPSGLPCWKPDPLKTLREQEKTELEADWSEDEVKKALNEMACDKSPGGDGLPKELFERHWDLLREDFMGFVKQFESSAVLPEEVQEAVTILLHKKGPKEQVQNYRPITLLSS
ncbi:unnamed protein product [Closterium sp. Yama58-4]|nr:unnamed protein product [Closterium sp. Yama58-4]